MPAGFLITRLLLVCLLSDVYYKSAFATAQQVVQPQVWQGAQIPYDYLIPQYVPQVQTPQVQTPQVQTPEAQGNPWLKLMESLMKNHGIRQGPKPQNVKQQLAKYPAGVVAAPAQPSVEAKKIELNMNIPLHYILKGLSQARKEPNWLHEVKESVDLSQSRVPALEEVSAPTRSDQKALVNQLKRKGTSENPGFHIKLTAPIQSLRDKGLNLQRLGHIYQDKLELLKQGLPETVPNWPILHHVVGPIHGPVQSLQTPDCSGLGCHQAQLQPHWTLFRNFLYSQRPQNPSAGSQGALPGPNLPQVQHNPQVNPNPPLVHLSPPSANPNLSPAQHWTEQTQPGLQGFQQPVGLQSRSRQSKQQIVVPDRKWPPDGSMAYPRFGPRASPPASPRQTEPIQWVMCPRFYAR